MEISYFIIGLIVCYLNYHYRKNDTRNFTDCCGKKPTVFVLILWIIIWPVVLVYLLYDFFKGD